MLSRLDVRELYERSKDGKSNRWDKIGEIVKIRFVEVTRLGELLARHKAVDAFVAQKIDATVDMQLQMDQITQRLLEGRERLLSAEAADLRLLFSQRRWTSRLYEQRFGTRSRTRQVRCRYSRGLIGEKHILIRITSHFLAPSLPLLRSSKHRGMAVARPFPAGCRENRKSGEKIAEKLI